MSADDEVVYELDDWDDEGRGALTAALAGAGIEHEWEDTTLVVQEDDEEAVERLMDELDAAVSVDLVPGVEQVAYDLSQWSDDQRAGLVEILADAEIAHGWEGSELFVHELDEQRVDELLGRITDPNADLEAAVEADAIGGEAAAEVMSELFVACDRLMHDSDDHEGTLSLIDAARQAAIAGVPYGLEEEMWSSVLADAAALAELVAHAGPDADTVMEQAAALRERLRPLV
jgi:hypothetical protein